VTAQDSATVEGHRSWRDWLVSDGVLGSLVVLFTIATAFASYRVSVAEIEGGDLDVDSQNSLILSAALYQESNLIMMDDSLTYNSYRLLSESDPEAATEILETASPTLIDGLARPEGPFDQQYEDALYEDARALVAEAASLNEQGNQADDLARQFQQAAFILAIGLAITAWASLFDTRPKLRLIFVLLALPSLVAGLSLVAVAVVG
jgi:hypothetical protein